MKRLVLVLALALLPVLVGAQVADVIAVTNPITTTAVTADQVVATYTVTGGKKLFLEWLEIEGRLTTVSGTASILGECSLEYTSGSKRFTHTFANPTTSVPDRVFWLFPPERVTVLGGNVVRVVCTPAATTSMLWRANFGGYER